MTKSANPPSFMAVLRQTWKANGLYRVYVLPDELVCVWAGKGHELRAVYMQFGLLGGLLAAATSPAKENAARSDELDAKPLDELRDDHEQNFSLAVEDIVEAEIVSPFFGLVMSHLRVRAPGHEPLILNLPTREEADKARQLLPSALGPLLKMEAAPEANDEQARRSRVFGAVGALLGAGIVGKFLLSPPLGKGAYAAGQIAGLILGVLLLVVGLHAVKTGASRKESSQRGRVPPFVWVLGTLCVIILCGFMIWRAGVLNPAGAPGARHDQGPNPINRQDPPAPIPPPLAKTAPVPNAVPAPKTPAPVPRNWQPFTSSEFGFTVSLPGVPEHTARKAGNTPRTVHDFVLDTPGAHFAIRTFVPPTPGTPAHLFQAFRALRGDFPMGQIGADRPLTLGAYRGQEFTIRFVDRQIVRRTYEARGRTYTLELSTPVPPPTPSLATPSPTQEFFESFRPQDADQPEPEAPARSSAGPAAVVLTAPSEIVSLVFDPEGRTLRAACQNGEVVTWDAQTAKPVKSNLNPDPNLRLVAAAQSEATGTGVASALSGRCNLLDLENYELKAILVDKLSPEFVWSVAISDDGRLAATGHRDYARVWNVADGKQLATLKTGTQVNSLLFLPGGNTVAAGTRNSTVTLFATPSGTLLGILKGRPEGVASAGALWALACSPDSKLLAAGGNDQTVRLWDLDTRTERHVFKHDQTVRSVAFIEAGKTLVAGDDAGTVTLWDTFKRTHTTVLPAPTTRNSARALAYSAKTGVLASGLGYEVRLWKVEKWER